MSVSPPTEKPAPDSGQSAGGEVRPRGGLIFLVLLLLGGSVFAFVNQSLPVVLFILAIVVMVMIHEAGHFVVAKWAGMKVTQFFFGFGPRLWSFRRGETEYGVRALPLGGFVKIIGMSNMERDVDPADEPRTYRQQSYGKRVAVAVAGVVTHFIVAFLVLTLVWAVIGVYQTDRPSLEIASITADSAAQRAGFRVGDRLVAIDGKPITSWNELPPIVQEKPGQRVTFAVERDGRTVSLAAVPTEVERDGRTVGFLGVGPLAEAERVNLPVAMGRSAKEVGTLTVDTVKTLGSVLSPDSLRNYADQMTGEPQTAADANRPISVVGAARLADQAAEYDIRWALRLFVVLNIFVAVLNMIPLLPFDGGHVAIATYERIRSRRGRRYQADVAKMMPVTVAVIGFFLLLGVTSIWLDIVRPVENPFR